MPEHRGEPDSCQALIIVSGFRVSGFRGLGFTLGFRGLGFWGFGVWGFRVQGLGFRGCAVWFVLGGSIRNTLPIVQALKSDENEEEDDSFDSVAPRRISVAGFGGGVCLALGQHGASSLKQSAF